MSEHTPGPWQLSARPVGTGLLAADGSWYGVLSKDGGLIALVNDWDDAHEEAAANRLLIRAAPALLAALERLERAREAFQSMCFPVRGEEYTRIAVELEEAGEQARAAIARAKHDQQR